MLEQTHTKVKTKTTHHSNLSLQSTLLCLMFGLWFTIGKFYTSVSTTDDIYGIFWMENRYEMILSHLKNHLADDGPTANHKLLSGKQFCLGFTSHCQYTTPKCSCTVIMLTEQFRTLSYITDHYVVYASHVVSVLYCDAEDDCL